MPKTKMLLIEDDSNISSLLVAYLTERGYDIVAFDDGPEALEHVGKHGLPDIVVSGLNQRRMHGFELARKLHAMGDVPIIFASADAQVETIVTALDRYADDYVIKPFDVRELDARIRRILKRVKPSNGPVA